MAAETTAHLAGLRSAPVALCAIVLAPGIALTGLLPASLRAHPLAALAAAPALGLAACSVVLVSASRLGVPIDGWSTRALVAAVCIAGFALREDRPRHAPRRQRCWEVAGLVGALALGALLQARVLGSTPVPGNDWAKYVLYADEIRRQGAVLIDNPLWMLGVPFRDDPGAPAVFGAALAMSGAPAVALAQGIWALAITGTLAVFALVRSSWGPGAGCLAAALYGVVPANHDILAWHGLANVAALALLALALAYVVALVRDEPATPGPVALRSPQLAGFALVLVALAATHRLTTLVAAAALALALAIAIARMAAPRRRATARRLALTGAFVAALGAAVGSDLLVRQRTSGGTQGHEAYLATKVDLGPALLDLTIPLTVAAALAVVALAVRRPRDARLVPVACLLGVTVAMAYAWLAELPLYYRRMVYYLPLAVVPLVAVWVGGWRRPRAALAGGLALVIAVATLGWGQARRAHEFYAFADPAALRGLDWVADRLRPGEVVVTDRCWSFLATWLLHTRTLAALQTHDIGPAAEIPPARHARGILAGRPGALARARELGVRYVIVNPTCVDLDSRTLRAPLAGRPVYVSRRLTVLELERGASAA